MQLRTVRRRVIRRILISAALLALASLALWWLWIERGPSDPNALWRQADADADVGRYDRVEAALARLGRLRSPTPDDWYLRAKLAMAQERTDEAVSDLAKIPDAAPLGGMARLRTGQIELRRDRWRHAETALRAASALDPRLVQAHRELIFLYSMQSRRAELGDQFRALSDLTALTFDDLFRWCLTRNTQWEPREIIAAMTRCVRADPADRWSRLALAAALRRVGRIDDAASALEPLPESDAEARMLRAEIALDRGDDRAAAALLAGGPEDHPGLARLRGRTALARHDGPAALDHYRIAAAADRDDRDTLFGLAAALVLTGNEAEAAPLLAAARAHDHLSALIQRAAGTAGRDNLDLLRSLGAACEAVGHNPEARAWYGLALEKDPFDPEARRGLERAAASRTPSGRLNTNSRR
jgi:tetratricopeptide (TPR) repeat protein